MERAANMNRMTESEAQDVVARARMTAEHRAALLRQFAAGDLGARFSIFALSLRQAAGR